MSGVGRYVKFTAEPGRGDELAKLLLQTAETLRDTPGCELYVINRAAASSDEIWVTGSGRVKIDDEVADVRALDAVRVAPASARAFEAGPDGLEFVVFGPHHTGDAVIEKDFWPTEVT